MANSLEQQIAAVIARAAYLTQQIQLENANVIADAAAVITANNKPGGDPVGAALNEAGRVKALANSMAYADELKNINTPVTGVLALLQAQKQVATNAQQAIVNDSLNAQQKADLQAAQIKADASKPAPASNTTTYVIIGVVVIIVIASVFMFIKMRK